MKTRQKIRFRLTLFASHIFTVPSKEAVAKVVESGLNRTSAMSFECPSDVVNR